MSTHTGLRRVMEGEETEGGKKEERWRKVEGAEMERERRAMEEGEKGERGG